jgi:hypothetical protein
MSWQGTVATAADGAPVLAFAGLWDRFGAIAQAATKFSPAP